MSQSQENVRAEGRRDRQTIFYRTLPTEDRDATCLQQVTGGNTPYLVLNRMLRLKFNLSRKYYNFKAKMKRQKRKLIQKRKLETRN